MFSLANLGLPALSGFPGEFYTIVSLVQVSPTLPVFVFPGFYLTGVYTLSQLNRTPFGETQSRTAQDMPANVLAASAILLFWCLVLGFIPDVVFSTLEVSLFSR